MYRLFLVTAVALTVLAGRTGAQAPATAPATQPASPQQIARWVGELSADDFAVRDAATQALRRCGTSALQQLDAAASATDPDVAHRAQLLIQQIKGAGQVAKFRLRDQWKDGAGSFDFSVGQRRFQGKYGEGLVSVTITEGKKTVCIDDSPEVIVVTVTDVVDGQIAASEYRGKDPEALWGQSPDALKIYNEYAQVAVDGMKEFNDRRAALREQIRADQAKKKAATTQP